MFILHRVLRALAAALTVAVSVGAAQPAPNTDDVLRYIDVDGDGLVDRLVKRPGGALAIELNRGSGRFSEVAQSESLPAVAVRDVLVGDLDGDRLADLYLVGPGANVALLGDGQGRFRDATTALGLVDDGHGLSAERLDVDGDGAAELLLHNVEGDVLFWAEAPGFRRDPQAPTRVSELAPADLALLLSMVADGRIEPARVGGQALVFTPAPGGGLFLSTVPAGSVAGPGQPAGVSSSLGLTLDDLKAIFVDEGMNEVSPQDIPDGSLTGGDISTHAGDVTLMGGRLGIGTTAPQQALHVQGKDTRLLLTDSDNPAMSLELRNNGSGTNYLYARGESVATMDITPMPNDGTGTASIRFFRGTSTTGTKRVQFLHGDNTTTVDAQIGVDGQHSFIRGGGHFGINTSTPEVPIHIRTGTDASKAGGGYFMMGDSASTNVVIDNNEIMARNNGNGATLSLNAEGGDVKVCANGAGKLVAPSLQLVGGADVVEGFHPLDEAPEPGTVVSVTDDGSGRVTPSAGPYDTAVVGVVSGAGDVRPGLELGQAGVADGEVKVAMVGRVYVRCTTEGGPIRAGDRLVSSGTVGLAMRADDPSRCDGAVLGKALGALESGEGLVLVLVNLQ